MKMVELLCSVLAFVLFLGGCASPCEDGNNLPKADTNVSVVTAQGVVLSDAIILAATRRRWVPEKTAPDTIRCTMTQRKNHIVIDIKVIGNESYSVHCVSNNIPLRKYEAWLNNLTREIARYARTNDKTY